MNELTDISILNICSTAELMVLRQAGGVDPLIVALVRTAIAADRAQRQAPKLQWGQPSGCNLPTPAASGPVAHCQRDQPFFSAQQMRDYVEADRAQRQADPDLTIAYMSGVADGKTQRQVGQEVTLCQSRMCPAWEGDQRRWSAWADCAAESADNYERITPYNDWHYEVRRLYTAPQPARGLDDVQFAEVRRINELESVSIEAFRCVGRAVEQAHGIK